ncbi:hypothetical protein J6590_092290 [Homalodisca vitripennis]|nr:hypothetical protein J6590_092290 [Homalodisca vitripennis]
MNPDAATALDTRSREAKSTNTRHTSSCENGTPQMVKQDMIDKICGSQRRGVILQQDNTRPHNAQLTWESNEKMGWDVLSDPTYSPDAANRVLDWCVELNKVLRMKRFQEDENVIEVWRKLVKHKISVL